MIGEREARKIARGAVSALQRDDVRLASSLTDPVFQPGAPAWGAYLVFRETASLVSPVGFRAQGGAESGGVWSPLISPGDRAGRVFALRFTAALMNDDDAMMHALFDAEFEAVAGPGGAQRFAESFACLLALAAVWGVGA